MKTYDTLIVIVLENKNPTSYGGHAMQINYFITTVSNVPKMFTMENKNCRCSCYHIKKMFFLVGIVNALYGLRLYIWILRISFSLED